MPNPLLRGTGESIFRGESLKKGTSYPNPSTNLGGKGGTNEKN